MIPFIKYLKKVSQLMLFIGRYIPSFICIITGNYSNLLDLSADHLFNPKNNNKDYNNPDIHDLFHIYLSKLLYESSDRIKEQCIDWGF